MDVFVLIMFIIGAVVLSSFVSRFIPKVSTPLIQIGLGALASWLPGIPETQLNPELFMVLFIAPLLYVEARDIDKSALLKTLKLSLSMAIGLVLVTMISIGFVLHAIWPTIPLAAALALGAALGPTDAVAVSSLGSDAKLTSRQRSVLLGESLFNDATGVVGFQFSILAAVTGTFSMLDATEQFLLSFVGGSLFGIAVGLLANWVFETARSFGWETTTSRVLMELFLPFLLYLGAEDIAHVSGILAVVASGLFVRFDRTGIGPNVARTNIVSNSVWTVITFTLNGAVFILLGMQLPGALGTSWDNPTVSNRKLLACILLVSFVLIALRFIFVSLVLMRTRDQKTGKRRPMTAERWTSAAIMTVGGPKGTITLSLLFTIPYLLASGDPFPMRSALIFIASGVIIVTLLLANFLLPILAPATDDQDKVRQREEFDDIRLTVIRNTVEELAGRVTPENRRAVLPVIDSYTKRISRLKQSSGITDPQGLQELQIEALNWEKDYIKERINRLKATLPKSVEENPDDPAQLQLEACERLMDQIMNTLRHTASYHGSDRTIWQIRGRARALQRRITILRRRIVTRLRRRGSEINEQQVLVYMRQVQGDVIEYVIDRLYDEMSKPTYSTEHCSALLLDYRRAEAALRNRPNMGRSAEAIQQEQEAKRESYAIELGIIQDMLSNGKITRNQARQLRRDVYVMQVDADSRL